MVQGVGEATGHFGELLQGAIAAETPEGFDEIVVTLPAPIFRCRAMFRVDPAAPLTILPQGGWKALDAARLSLSELGKDGTGGVLSLENDAPAGVGAGSSTLDVVATIRAVADAHGERLAAATIARLAVAAEGASDPTMFPASPVPVFAFRRATVPRWLPAALPPLRVLGFCDGAPVESLGMRRRFTPARLAEYARLIDRLGLALDSGDVAGLGAIASASARLSQEHLRKEKLDLALAVANRQGAAGVAVAHSGSLTGLLFDPTARDCEVRVTAAKRDLATHGVDTPYDFEIHKAPVSPPASTVNTAPLT
jgi:uncharacterized protein involved in propanediol utilization